MAGLILKSPYIQCGKNGKSISGYMKYIATRPRVEKLGSHGLFGDEDAVSLGKTMDELDSYSRPTGALNAAMAAYEKRMISNTITAAFHSYRGRCVG